MRLGVLALLLLPYLYYGIKDAIFHFHGRKVSTAEHLIHLALGVGAAGVVAGVFLTRREQLLRSLPLLLGAGALDEFLYHRALPEAESDLHAKAHWALFIFVSTGMLWG